MNNNPLVSIIIPVYNSEKYISETINSALKQTWKNKEILIIDDGSSDNSPEIISQFKDLEIKVFSQRNKGAASARNYGLKEAKGEYIQFLDADDLLSSYKIEKQVAELISHPGNLAICNSIHFDDGTDPYKMADRNESRFLHNSEDPGEFLFNLYGGNGAGWMVSLHSWLSPAEVINKAGNWNEELSLDDDGEFFCRVVLASSGLRFVPDVYSYYRKFNNGQSVSISLTLKSLQSGLRSMELKEQYLFNAIGNRAGQIFASQYQEYAINAYPQFMPIYRESFKKYRESGISIPVKTKSGIFSKIISTLLGWKTARWMSYLKHNTLKL